MKEVPSPRIAVLCPDAGGDVSVSLVARRQVQELAREFNVVMFSRRSPLAFQGIDHEAVPATTYPWLRRFAHVPNELAFVRAMRRRLQHTVDAGGVDAVICHGHALAALAAWPVKKARRTPYALVVHGDIFDRPKGTYDSRMTRFYRWVTPIAYRHADIVFAISPRMAERAIAGGARSDKVFVVPNGIDPADIGLDICSSTLESGCDLRGCATGADRVLNLLFVGRLSVEKGVLVLLDACALLKERGVPFRLIVVGSGPLGAEIARRTSNAGLERDIHVMGVRPRRELGRLYAAADLTLVPSLSEAQGLVVLESLLCGTPVVGSDTGGIPMMVRDGTNGLLCPPGDASKLAATLEDLSNDRDKISALVENTRDSVWPAFSWSRTGDSLVEHFKHLLGPQGAAGRAPV